MWPMITPSNFRADPLGWAGNQAGHILIAAMFAYWMAVIGYLMMGEYPYRWTIFGALVAVYLALEVPQNGETADTIEDILVVLAYGGGVFIWSMKEITPGLSALNFDPVAALPLVGIMNLHFALGMAVRWWQSKTSDSNPS
jgi:hypothetical protein